MTGAGSGRRRGVVVVGLVVVWALVLGGLSFWSVGRDEASVPEQRSIGQALPELQRAAGALVAAAGGENRAVMIGQLVFEGACRVTPVRAGISAVRDVTVFVRDGEARVALDAIAAGLPSSYAADVWANERGTWISLHADAGDFIGIDAEVEAAAKEITLRLSTGCRPQGGGDGGRDDPATRAAPQTYGRVVEALSGAGTPETRAVACPDGTVAASYVLDGVATPADFDQRMRLAVDGASVVRGDDDVRAYRKGGDSVVVLPAEDTLLVAVSTSC